MEWIKGKPDWVGSYLEWMNIECVELALPGEVALQEAPGTDANASEEFSLAYLEWMDADQRERESGTRSRSTAPANTLSGLDALGDAMLLAALRAESECVHILRHSADAGYLNEQTAELAVEVLGHAGRLLEDARHTRQALSALYHHKPPRTRGRRQSDQAQDWPRVLEHMAADVHALTGKVLALQTA